MKSPATRYAERYEQEQKEKREREAQELEALRAERDLYKRVADAALVVDRLGPGVQLDVGHGMLEALMELEKALEPLKTSHDGAETPTPKKGGRE